MKVVYHEREWSLKGPKTLNEVIQYCNIRIGTVIAVRDCKVLTKEDIINDNDLIEFVDIISGGSIPVIDI